MFSGRLPSEIGRTPEEGIFCCLKLHYWLSIYWSTLAQTRQCLLDRIHAWAASGAA
jgi:hypothetical protein